MTLESNKNLGGIGTLLIIVSPVAMGAAAAALCLIGLILLLIALNGMAKDFKESKIYDNALYGILIAIVGLVVSVAVVLVTAIATLSRYGIDLFRPADWSRMGLMFSNLANFEGLWAIFGGVAVALAVAFVFIIVAVIFLRRSLLLLSAKTGVHMFSTAGLIMLIGAVLTIVAVGFLLLWIAFVLLTVAFFSIKTK